MNREVRKVRKTESSRSVEFGKTESRSVKIESRLSVFSTCNIIFLQRIEICQILKFISEK
jgi:hypothetical protein